MLTKQQVVDRIQWLGMDISGWSDEHIQRVVDIVNAPAELPKSPMPYRWPWSAR